MDWNMSAPGRASFSTAMFFRCMSPSAISRANIALFDERVTSSVGDVDMDRRARAARSMVLSYLDELGRSRTHHMSSRASSRWSSLPVRMSKRSTTRARCMLSGMGTNAIAGLKNRRRPRATTKAIRRQVALQIRRSRTSGVLKGPGAT